VASPQGGDLANAAAAVPFGAVDPAVLFRPKSSDVEGDHDASLIAGESEEAFVVPTVELEITVMR
jgi:hypothetical protein